MHPIRVREAVTAPGAASVALVAVAVSVAAALVEFLTPVDLDVPSGSAGIETAITALGLVTAGFLGLWGLAHVWFARRYPIVSPRLLARIEEEGSGHH